MRVKERARKKFRGHRIDGMVCRAPLALLLHVVTPLLQPVVVSGLERNLNTTKHTGEPVCGVFTQGLWAYSHIPTEEVQRSKLLHFAAERSRSPCFGSLFLNDVFVHRRHSFRACVYSPYRRFKNKIASLPVFTSGEQCFSFFWTGLQKKALSLHLMEAM